MVIPLGFFFFIVEIHQLVKGLRQSLRIFWNNVWNLCVICYHFQKYQSMFELLCLQYLSLFLITFLSFSNIPCDFLLLSSHIAVFSCMFLLVFRPTTVSTLLLYLLPVFRQLTLHLLLFYYSFSEFLLFLELSFMEKKKAWCIKFVLIK